MEGFQRLIWLIIRLSSYENEIQNDIPNNVSINEAVELAKKYAMTSQRAFINGVSWARFMLSSRRNELKNIEENNGKNPFYCF